MIIPYSLILVVLGLAGTGRADMLFSHAFEGPAGLTIMGNAQFWGLAPLGGMASYPSGFSGGGSQAGGIFYGAWGYDSTALLTLDLPDMSGYTDIELTVALAAPGGTTWESTHRDSLLLGTDLGDLDSFLPNARGAPLTSVLHSVDLGPTFADFAYRLDPAIRSVSFAFASTAGNEVVGIDSLAITGSAVPLPGAALLGVLGLAAAGLRLRMKNNCRRISFD